MLKIFCQLRIKLSRVNDLAEVTKLVTAHGQRLERMGRRYRSHPVLAAMIAEEKNQVAASFSRIGQPGYSREMNVVSAQQELFERLENVVEEETDKKAWELISKTLESKLALRLISFVERSAQASFDVRSSISSASTIELGITRFSSEKACHYIASFESVKKNILQSQVDGLFTLHSTIFCLFKIRDLKTEITLTAREAATGQIARQVAHDIESPIAGLEESIRQLTGLGETERVAFRNSITRIKDIVASLRLKRDEPRRIQTEAGTVELLSSVIESIVSQKRLEYRARLHIQIDALLDSESYGIFSQINSTDFQSIISNVVNNSVESFIADAGSIEVSLRSINGFAAIEIKDNGCGVPASLLPKLFDKGASFNKSRGSGLGLYNARKKVEQWHGSIDIKSSEGVGTVVTILLPKASPPQWFVPELVISSRATIVIVDDDSSVHQIWKNRFQSFSDSSDEIKLVHLATVSEIDEWRRVNAQLNDVLYLLDYELLGQPKTGLQIIESLGIGEKAILVTSHFEDRSIRAAAHNLGVRIIPKGIAAFVPLVSASTDNGNKVDAVLIDDDQLIQRIWKTSALRHHKIILAYSSVDDFLAAAATTLPRAVPIFIDSCLGDGVKGEVEAGVLCKAGFSELALTTGESDINLKDYPWIKRIIGKTPPWDLTVQNSTGTSMWQESLVEL